MNQPTLFTACTGIARRIPDTFRKAAIMRWSRWWTWDRYPTLAPSAVLLKAFKQSVVSLQQFDARFRAELAELDVDQVVADLGSPTILFCVERDPADCHRSIVAEWLHAKAGIVVPEYQVKAPEPTLFPA